MYSLLFLCKLYFCFKKFCLEFNETKLTQDINRRTAEIPQRIRIFTIV